MVRTNWGGQKSAIILIRTTRLTPIGVQRHIFLTCVWFAPIVLLFICSHFSLNTLPFLPNHRFTPAITWPGILYIACIFPPFVLSLALISQDILLPLVPLCACGELLTSWVSVKVWVVGLCSSGVCGTDTAKSTLIGKSRGVGRFLCAVLCRLATFTKEVCREPTKDS